MAALSGKMTALLLLILLVLLGCFALTPLILAPFGIFAGLARGIHHATFSGWHFGPWFPFVPLWSLSLLFFFLWIVVIVWVYRDAEERGMSGVLWALLVFIGNLIGLLIFLIVRQDHPLPSSGKPAAAPSPSPPPKAPPLACPSCQKPVEKGFTYCPHCGAALQRVCKNCGKPVESSWKACPYCGSAM